jgi:hypothetical protein
VFEAEAERCGSGSYGGDDFLLKIGDRANAGTERLFAQAASRARKEDGFAKTRGRQTIRGSTTMKVLVEEPNGYFN